MKPSVKLTEYLRNRVETIPAGALKRLAPRGGVRMVTAWALHSLCPGLGFASISHRLGYSDHTGAVHGHTRVSATRHSDHEFRLATDEVLRDARAVHADLIEQVERAAQSRPAKETIRGLMANIRRTANRLDVLLDRLETRLSEHEETK